MNIPATLFSSPARTSLALFIFCIASGLQRCHGLDAPNPPGLPSVWAPGSKDLIGTAASPLSKIYFTGAQGMLTEVFYPSPDTVQNIDMEFLVEDAAKTFGPADGEEKLQHTQSVRLVDKRAMLWEASTTANNGAWRIIKRIFTDPARSTLVERVVFQVLDSGKSVSDFDLFVLNHPGINNAGGNDNSRSITDGNRILLAAWKPNAAASALGVSLPWKHKGALAMVSNGFVGQNDG
ncbi:MAG TPA: hypothetical protein VGV18_10060, partial [Verrucomicrobiae bacterium]|nr:hypothetical protein [Verrucomicrobiae bacterium]